SYARATDACNPWRREGSGSASPAGAAPPGAPGVAPRAAEAAPRGRRRPAAAGAPARAGLRRRCGRRRCALSARRARRLGGRLPPLLPRALRRALGVGPAAVDAGIALLRRAPLDLRSEDGIRARHLVPRQLPADELLDRAQLRRVVGL